MSTRNSMHQRKVTSIAHVADIGTVKIGTPPRDFHLLMDSGSADFWVGGEGCRAPDDGDCVKPFVYHFKESCLKCSSISS